MLPMPGGPPMGGPDMPMGGPPMAGPGGPPQPGGGPGNPQEIEQLLTSTVAQLVNVAEANGIDFEMIVSRVTGRGGGRTPNPPLPSAPKSAQTVERSAPTRPPVGPPPPPPL